MNDNEEGYVPTGPLDPVAEQIAGFFGADPVWQALTTNPMADTRAAFKAATPVSGEPAIDHVEDFKVLVARGEIGLRLYRPTPQPPAILVWAHGGGFAMGSLDESDNFARALAQASGLAIVTVDYGLAPEHKFPTALHDLMAAVQWVSERRSQLAGGDVPLVVGGDSAGANLATVATRKLHEAKSVSIAANVLAYPSTDSPDAESLRRFEPPFLRIQEVSFFLNQYLPDEASRTDPDVAPLHATNLDLLPPTLIITAEHDIITEQAESYGRKLAAAGVDTRISRHPGMIHGFVTLDFFFQGAAGTAMREIKEFVESVAH